MGELPLPGWHTALAMAWQLRVGPAGGLRTLASAIGGWANLVRLMRFLDTAPHPPADPSELTEAHLDAFRRHRQATIGSGYAWREIRELGLLFRAPSLRDRVATPALDYLRRRTVKSRPNPKPGYSDNELQRIVAAARGDVARLRERLETTAMLLERYDREPGALADHERDRAAALAAIAASGLVPLPPGHLVQQSAPRHRLAQQLFVTRADLVPMLVLLVATTGWNLESVKELPTEHRILEDRAVELFITKRRRGPRHWRQIVTWEIGPQGRELHTPGGLYLLLHRLMARSRDLLDSAPAFWAVWRNMHRPCARETAEHYNPFGSLLNRNVYAPRWVARHRLTADPPPPKPMVPASGDGHDNDLQPLKLDFNRLKTSIEVRRAKHTGGHLPSVARSNTVPVLFRNYLRGDPTTIDWAHEVVTDAFGDVEQAAWAAHERALNQAGGRLRVVPGDATASHFADTRLDSTTAEEANAGSLDTAWSACTNHDQHPTTGQACRASFLDCFHCGNCLITQAHLPRLLGLLDAMSARRLELSEDDWWARYGPAWAAIRFDVLAKFTPPQIEQAKAAKPTDVLLDLVEPTWEHP
ncbi:hypothetical protein ACIQAR_22560 [Micromonospora chalcea]